MPQTPEQQLAVLQQVADRAIEGQLSQQQRIVFDEAVNRGLVTIPTNDAGERVMPFRFQERPLSEQLLGTGEMLLTTVTGALATATAGAQGVVDLTAGFVMGDDQPLANAVEGINDRVQRRTFQPRSEAGQESLQAISTPVQGLFENVIRPAAEFTQDATGSTLLPTGVEVAAEFFPPGAATFRRGPAAAAIGQRQRGQQRMIEIQEQTGVDVTANARTQGEQLVEGVRNLVNDQEQRAQDFEVIQQELITAREVAQANVDTLFDQARETNAAIRVPALNQMVENIRGSINTIDIRDLAGEVLPERQILAKRLEELNQIQELPENGAVKLDALSRLRERLRTDTSDAQQNRALGIIRGELDATIDGAFNADMVTGDPAAIQRWNDAREAFKTYRENFNDDRVIRQFVRQETTPEQLKQWLIGASSVGAKTEAAAVVNRIGDVLGRDSAAFSAIRQEVIFDVVRPLLQPDPNIPQFIRNYDRFVVNQPSLTEALIPESLEPLGELRNLVATARDVRSAEFNVDLVKFIARTQFGHELSRGQARIGLAEQAMRQVIRVATPSGKQNFINEVLGFDPNIRVLPIAPVAAIGAFQTAGREQEEGNEDER